jgi:hypothetical protein
MISWKLLMDSLSSTHIVEISPVVLFIIKHPLVLEPSEENENTFLEIVSDKQSLLYFVGIDNSISSLSLKIAYNHLKYLK